jgi:cell division protease FtsH
MNNKGFNWFFPIAIIALLLFFGSNFLGGDTAKTIDEDGF